MMPNVIEIQVVEMLLSLLHQVGFHMGGGFTNSRFKKFDKNRGTSSRESDFNCRTRGYMKNNAAYTSYRNNCSFC